MNTLLIIRSEIFSIFIILFLIIYDVICSRYRDGKDYFKGFAITALGHVSMGLVTEITVNIENFPVLLNNFFHMLFFTFALIFSLKYFEYVLSLIFIENKRKKIIPAAYILSLASICIMAFSKIDYLQGDGTKYSAGTGPTLCYMLGFIFFTVADVIVLINYKKISRQIVFTMLPLSVLAIAFMIVQIIVPEFLFTGAALTLVAVAVFFSMENPIGKFQDRALIDQDTQCWNKNCYDYDLINKINKILGDSNESLIYVLADINGLKTVNDTYGHLAGDRMIAEAARIMVEKMSNSFKVYRIGGDEFAAIYINTPVTVVENEISDVILACENSKTKVSISLGYAEHIPGDNIEKTVQRADIGMYKIKDKYYRTNNSERRK